LQESEACLDLVEELEEMVEAHPVEEDAAGEAQPHVTPLPVKPRTKWGPDHCPLLPGRHLQLLKEWDTLVRWSLRILRICLQRWICLRVR